jgi:Ycf66 protein N-terminus
MLTILLALGVGLGSFALYMSAFLYPEVYRKGDLIWSGVGLFYALVLWICADRITGGVLLGQLASVSLIGWFGWQTMTARLGYVPTTGELQTRLSDALKPENRSQLIEQAKQQFSTVRDQAQGLINKVASPPSEAPAAEPYEPLTREDFGNPTPTIETAATEAPKADVKGAIASVTSAIGSLFKKPPKNTSTYVRKEFQEPTEGFEADAIASEKAVESGTVAVNQDGAAESTIPADEIVQEEIAYEAAKTAPSAVAPEAPESTPDTPAEDKVTEPSDKADEPETNA